MAAKKRTKKRIPAGARKRRGGFPCPECDFVAKHAMGLGRHRSTRHGVVSRRAQQRRTGGAWITREQAAARAGVHYNTIRQWERAGLLAQQKKPGVRGALVNVSDLNRLLAERAAPSAAAAGGGADAAALAAMEIRFSQLVEGLESLLATLKGGSKVPPANGRRRRARSTNGRKKTSAKKRATKKATKRPAKRATKKRSTAKKRSARRR